MSEQGFVTVRNGSAAEVCSTYSQEIGKAALMLKEKMEGTIGVKEAVQTALAYAKELFPESAERAAPTLEEVEPAEDRSYWYITLGLADSANPLAIAALGHRKYKVFKVNAHTGEVESVKIRTADVTR